MKILTLSHEDFRWVAERKGFEPLVPAMSTTVFETAPFDHSGISPGQVQNYNNYAIFQTLNQYMEQATLSWILSMYF